MIGTLIFGLYQFFVPIERIEDIFRYIMLGIIGGIGGIISFVGAILFLIGRKEFGERHQRFVIYALICIVIGVIASFAVSIVSSFMMIVAQGGDVSRFSSASVFFPTITGAITGGLAYVFSLYELQDDNGRKLLYTAFVVSILISVLIAFLSSSAIEGMVEETSVIEYQEDFASIISFTSSVTQYSLLGLISSLLWTIAIYLPYKRIKNGELIPQSVQMGTSSSSVQERVCPNCGKTIPTDANNCPYCGKKFKSYL